MLEWDEITDSGTGNAEEPASEITSDNNSARKLSGEKSIIISAASVLILILLYVAVSVINGNNYISTKESNGQKIEIALRNYYSIVVGVVSEVRV